jgi:ethanolamine ammonia-lyase small subunit
MSAMERDTPDTTGGSGAKPGNDALPQPAAALAERLRSLTPARVALGRTGVSLETRDLLDFSRCHAMARDAVHARLEAAPLASAIEEISGSEVFRLHSAAADRATFLQRPDLGRKLDEPSRMRLDEIRLAGAAPQGALDGTSDLAIVVADGLSALAVERHAALLIRELMPHLRGWKLAPICLVEQGRVAIGDEIGAALRAEIAVVLLGERPGLSSPDSLGAYITWQPRPGRTDAERNCISNIRPEGLGYSSAARLLAVILNEARRLRLTGIALKAEARQLGATGSAAKEAEP